MLLDHEFNRHLIRPALLLIMVSVAANVLLPAGSHAQGQTANASRTPLQGEVQHDESLPSLPEDYQVGSHVDPDQLTALTANNLWYQIPNWFAGAWHSDSLTITHIEDCKSGRGEDVRAVRKEVSDVIHGHQRDKTGQIWEYLEVPKVEKMVVEKGICYLRTSREDILQSDPSAIVLKVLDTQLTVDKKQKVVDSQQVQQISTCQPLEDGLAQIAGSLKNFDASGDPLQIQTVEKVLKRTAPYQEVDVLGDRNLKPLFVEFLKKTGRQDLVPDGM